MKSVSSVLKFNCPLRKWTVEEREECSSMPTIVLSDKKSPAITLLSPPQFPGIPSFLLFYVNKSHPNTKRHHVSAPHHHPSRLDQAGPGPVPTSRKAAVPCFGVTPALHASRTRCLARSTARTGPASALSVYSCQVLDRRLDLSIFHRWASRLSCRLLARTPSR